MPERTVQVLTGSMPEPILVIPSDTWDTFELDGSEGEFITATIKRAFTPEGQIVTDINETLKMPTIKYTTRAGSRGTGVIIPKRVVHSYGIRLNHYLEVVLEKVEKAGKKTDIFPKRMVEEHFPLFWRHAAKSEED